MIVPFSIKTFLCVIAVGDVGKLSLNTVYKRISDLRFRISECCVWSPETQTQLLRLVLNYVNKIQLKS